MELVYTTHHLWSWANARFPLPPQRVHPSCYSLLLQEPNRVEIKDCYNVWAGTSQSSLSTHDRIQKRLYFFVGHELFSTLQVLSHRRDVTRFSLFYRYFHGVCSGEVFSLDSPVPTFTAKTRHATRIVANHIHSFCIPLKKYKSHFSGTTTLRKEIQREWFPDHYIRLSFTSFSVTLCLECYQSLVLSEHYCQKRKLIS